MVLFFDQLYTSVEAINPVVLVDWSHKETPKEYFCVIDTELAGETVIDAYDAWIADNEADAIAEMNEYNEGGF
jgi:predicted RecB family nuclease